MTIREQVQDRLTQVIFRLLNTLLHVSIRLGKTKIALDAIEAGDKVLWIYPSNAMMSGYQEDLIKFPPKSTDITFVNISSIKKYKNTNWDFVVIDEPQRCKSAAQIKVLKTITFKKRVGLSGTMNDKTLKILEQELGWTVGAKYTLENGIRDGIVKDYKVYIHFSDLCTQVKEIEGKKFGREVMMTEREAYDSYCSTMDYFEGQQLAAQEMGDGPGALRAKFGYMKYMSLRTNLLYNSRTLLTAANNLVHRFRDQKALIYALRTEIADQLSSKTFHSKNKDEEALEWFRTSETGHMGACNAVTTGITIRNLNLTIFHSYDSNTETFHQKLGRSLLYEFEGECANVHVCALRNTQNDHWLEKALASLELDKIYYVIDGVTDTKANWLKKQYPDKRLFQVKDTGAIIYYVGENEEGYSLYSFPANPDKTYSYKSQNLKQVA